MTDATLTEYSGVPIPGLKKGSAVGRDAYTSNFGFKTLKGVVCMSSDDDDVIVTVAVAAGAGTINIVDDAGADVTGADVTFYYIAWGE